MRWPSEATDASILSRRCSTGGITALTEVLKEFSTSSTPPDLRGIEPFVASVDMAARSEYGFQELWEFLLAYRRFIRDQEGFADVATRFAKFFDTAAPVWWQGAAGIFANCAFLLCGFQAISQVVEEKSAHLPFATLFRILVLAIGAASAFYCLVVIGTAIAGPWQSLPPHSLAFVEATKLLYWGDRLVPLVLAIAMLSLAKTWNGVFLAEVARIAPKGKVGLATAGSAFITFLAYSFGPFVFATSVSTIGAYGPVYAGVSALGIVAAIALLIAGRMRKP